jgi:DMSO/TMAO reductase YedYZ molybdopterin-dependent catalytic subunit
MLLAACDRLNESPWFTKILRSGETISAGVHKALVPRKAMAQEFSEADLSPGFRSNGTSNPDNPVYQALAQNGFVDWTLKVDGLVERSMQLSLTQLRAMPRRTQITRHDCVEGWSAIGRWTGPVLAPILQFAGLSDAARYIVFHCYDDFGGTSYYESIDLVDAFHPQTILAWALNGQALPVQNGAPLRLRVERQLGYKQAKYLRGIEAVASLDQVGGGKGGYWEDVADYAWFAGI